VVPNLEKLAPWVWDNIKVLFYWYVMSVPLVALWLSHLWKTGRVHRTVAATLFVTLILAGGLDVWRVVSRTAEYREFDRKSVEAAQDVMRHCEPGARILHAPVYNPAVSLTGRRSLLGYPGIIWSHGLDHTQRERDIRAIYAGLPEAPRLLANYKINYVLVSPAELAYTPVNQAFFRRYTRIAGSGGYNLYSVAP
jgi:hypothetical protein